MFSSLQVQEVEAYRWKNLSIQFTIDMNIIVHLKTQAMHRMTELLQITSHSVTTKHLSE